MIYYDFWNIFHSPIDFVHSLAGGGGTADQGLPLSDKAFEPQGHFSYCQALLLVLDVYHMGVGAFPFLRVTRRRHRDREYGTKGRGASHRPALNSNAHYFGRKSSVSGPMYVCCEDSSYRRQALKKVQLHNQHSTGPAQRRTRQY